MIGKFIPAAVLLASATMALAQNAPPAGAPGAQGGPGGGRPMMDPAARFKELDKNADGKVSLQEFEAMQMGMRQGAGAPPPPAGAPPAGGPGAMGGMGGGMISAADRFKAADKNNDGSLSQEEFMAMAQGMRRGGGMGGAGGAGN